MSRLVSMRDAHYRERLWFLSGGFLCSGQPVCDLIFFHDKISLSIIFFVEIYFFRRRRGKTRTRNKEQVTGIRFGCRASLFLYDWAARAAVRYAFRFDVIIELKGYSLEKTNMAEQKTDNRHKSWETRPLPE